MVQDIGFGYLMQGEIGEMIKWVLGSYFPYLIFYILIGVLIFNIVYTKSHNLSLSSAMFILYFITVVNFMSVGAVYYTIIKYITLVLVVFVFFLLYRLYKSSGE